MELKSLIVGLGNPDGYEGTRHNIGKNFLKYFAESQGLSFTKDKLSGGEFAFLEVAEFVSVIFLPEEYMNNSGLSLAKAISFFDFKHVSDEDILLVHDELDLPFSEIKISCGKSDAGHKGVRSVIETLGSKEFCRLRIGIDEDTRIPKDKFVLQKWSMDEMKALPAVYEQAQQALMLYLRDGAQEAMSKVKRDKH